MTITLIIIIGFTFIIFIHELGHFLAARRVGVKVDVFSIGIGPRLITVYKDKLGTSYILSLLPLGGYVKMRGQDDLPRAVRGEASVDHDSFLAKTPPQRLFIVVAGVVMNLVSAYFLIVFAYTLGVGFTTNKIGSVAPNAPLAKSDLTVGDSIVAINGKKTASFEDILTVTAFTGTNKEVVLTVANANQAQRTITTRAYQQEGIPIAQLGILPYSSATIRHLATDSSFYQSGLRNGMRLKEIVLVREGAEDLVRQTAPGMLGLMTAHPNERVNVFINNNDGSTAVISNVMIPSTQTNERGFELAATVAVTPEYPAAQAGLLDNDTILAIDKLPVRSFQTLQDIMNDLAVPNPLQVTVARPSPNNETTTLTFTLTPLYQAGNERFILGVSPKLYEENSQLVSYVSTEMQQQVPGIRRGDKIIDLSQSAFAWQAKVLRANAAITFSYTDEAFPQRTIGIPFPVTAGEKIIRYSFLEALYNSFSAFYRELVEVYLFIGKLIGGTLPASTIGGPIAIFDTFQTLSAVKGFSYFLLLFAKISISLAIINLLPIPVLDGGHATFILYEIIRRKPPPENIVRTMNLLGFILLVFLMIFVNYNDIMRIVNR